MPTPISILRVVWDFGVNNLTEATSSKAICCSPACESTSAKLVADIAPRAPRTFCLFLSRSSMLAPNGMPTICVVTLAVSGLAAADWIRTPKTRTADSTCRIGPASVS